MCGQWVTPSLVAAIKCHMRHAKLSPLEIEVL